MTEDLECIEALAVSLNPTECERLGNLVLALKNPDGGWTHEIALMHDKDGETEDPRGWRFRAVPRSESNVESTFVGLKALGCIRGQFEQKNGTVGFVLSVQNADAGLKSCHLAYRGRKA